MANDKHIAGEEIVIREKIVGFGFDIRKGWPLVLVLGAVVVAGFVLVWPRGEREPVYQGKKLSWWITTPPSTGTPQGVAIRKIGTNGLPWLLDWAQYERPTWERKVTSVSRSLHVNYQPGAKKAELAKAAWLGLQILGRQASPAIPELVRMTGNRHLAMQALETMRFIGPAAVPALMGALTNRDAMVRVKAAGCIIGMRNSGAKASILVPVLLSCLADKDNSVVLSAAILLGRLGTEPETVVPALASCMHNRDRFIRRETAIALGNFSQAARPAVPELIEALKDSDTKVRIAATNALQRIEPEVLEKQ
jgi:hypothetical protein